MNIRKTFSITKEEVKEKKFNVLIPICVGNKFFLDDVNLTDNIPQYVSWALEHTKEKILIVIVDKIQISNWIVRNSGNSYEQNMRRLMRKGEAIHKNLLELVKALPKNERERIEVLRWEDYCSMDLFCEETTSMAYEEFEDNEEFRENVVDSVKDSIVDRKFDEEDYLTLSNYVLGEFSLVYHGVQYGGTYFGLYIYPETDNVLELVEDIKRSALFSELSQKINNHKIAVVLLK